MDAPASHAAAAQASHQAEQRIEPDPLLRLMGWIAEPLLGSRLKWYIAESVFEAGCLVTAVYYAHKYMTPSIVFVRLELVPLFLVALKLVWCLRLGLGWCRSRGQEVAVVLSRLSTVHTRACWTCSSAFLTCLTCLLMMWHAIVFLLMTSYSAKGYEEHLASRMMLIMSAVFVMVNWVIWHDFVANYTRNESENTTESRALKEILNMHRDKAIRLHKYADLGHLEVVPTSCVVCLEEFREDDFVEQLPCGHTFHPTCAHKWIVEDRRCPFRCPLRPPMLQTQWEASLDVQPSSLGAQPASSGARPPRGSAAAAASGEALEEMDVEAGEGDD